MSFFTQIQETVPPFLHTLKDPTTNGRFFPCHNGRTRLGTQLSLGFSCFTLKLYHMFHLWPQLPEPEQKSWITYIQSFQTTPTNLPHLANSFIDPALIYGQFQLLRYPEQLAFRTYGYLRNPRKLYFDLLAKNSLNWQEQIILGETKQAIATLAELNFLPQSTYQHFPSTPETISHHLNHLDWSQPWGAGAQASALAVFLTTQGKQFLSPTQYNEAYQTFALFIATLTHNDNGGYYLRATPPSYNQLINGAMKLITALDWLEIPIHYPNQLIDTALSQPPQSDGCHLVDVVYVLYKCWQLTDHRRSDIIAYCSEILTMIEAHYNPDGGFSYYIGRSQTAYYGVRFSRGLPESDIHGTVLLSWATVMIAEILETNQYGWQPLKP